MQLSRTGLGILSDNEESYLSLLTALVESEDYHAQVAVVRGHETFHFRIIPTRSGAVDPIMASLNYLHNLLQLYVTFSKSIRRTSVVSFTLALK